MNNRIASLSHESQSSLSGFAATNSSPAFWSPRTENIRILRDTLPPASGSRSSDAPLIYAVDDMQCITELYSLVLEAAGYSVRAFTDRAKAQSALKAESKKPGLLITDYRNTSIPVERFMEECLLIHPGLRILMASGLPQNYLRFSYLRPHRFIQKPFTPEELLQEVESALRARSAGLT